MKSHVHSLSIVAFAILVILGGDYGIRYLMKTMNEKVSLTEFQSLTERVAKLEIKGGIATTPTMGRNMPTPLPMPAEANAEPIPASRKVQVAMPHPPSEDSGVTTEGKPFKLLTASVEPSDEKPKSNFKLLEHE